MIPRGSDGYYHPATEDELRELIMEARSSGRKLRVRGAGHSELGAYEAGPSGTNVLLNNLSAVGHDDANMQITVQAGCHLGVDPEDPSGTAPCRSSPAQMISTTRSTPPAS